MTTSLASQGTLNDLSNKFDGRTPVRIHFLDNSSKLFLVGSTATVKDVLRLCLEKYNIMDMEFNLPYYGLFESRNGGSVDGSLSLEAVINDVIQTWVDNKVDQTAKFLFMIRLHMPSISGLEFRDVVANRLHKAKSSLTTDIYLNEAKTTDPNALHLQFIQAVYNVITGRYPTTIDEALDLGAIHFLFKFNEFKPASHKVGFLANRIVEFIPIKHLKSGSSGTIADWEGRLFDRVQTYVDDSIPADTRTADGPPVHYFHRDDTPITAQRYYMNRIYAMSAVYGNAFYRCTQRSARALPEHPYVGINREGITIFDKNKKAVRSFHIEEIYRWGFKPSTMFYFEVSAEDNADLGTGSLEFDTAEGKAISDLLTDYAMAFLKEREQEDERAERFSRENGASSSSNGGTGSSLSSGAPKAPSSPAPPLPSTRPPPAPAAIKAPASKAPANGKVAAKAAEVKAAVKLQALFRGFSLRNEWSREDAAILIQSVFRGYQARIALSDMIEQMIQAGQL